MALNHFIVLFLLGIVNLSLGEECIGCPHKLNINDPALKKYLSNKLQDLKNVVPEGVQGEKEMELVRVKDAWEKVVSGVQHSYRFEGKGLNTKQMYDCKLTVLKKPWLGPEQVTEYSCHLLISSKMVSPGKEVVIDVQNNPKLEELKPFVSQEIGKAQQSQYMMTVINYLKATMQLVEGITIKTTVQVGMTNCPLNAGTDSNTDCQHQLRGKQVCDVTVWLKPWMKFKEITQVQCQPMEPINLMCVGCPVEEDPNSPFIKQSLEKALDKYNEEFQTSQKLTLVNINKAASQVVSGLKITVYFDAQDVESHENFNCNTVIVFKSSLEEQTVEDFNCAPISTN